MLFEDKMKRLEEIVMQMEKPGNPIEQVIELFKEGLNLSKELKAELSKFDGEVKKIMSDGSEELLSTEDFEIEI